MKTNPKVHIKMDEYPTHIHEVGKDQFTGPALPTQNGEMHYHEFNGQQTDATLNNASHVHALPGGEKTKQGVSVTMASAFQKKEKGE